MARPVAFAALAIVAFDAAVAVTAKLVDVDYGVLAFLGLLLYFGLAFRAGRVTGSTSAGVVVGAVMSLASATAGRALTSLIDPPGLEPGERTFGIVGLTITVALGAVIGLVAGFGGERAARRSG
jgi:hypothetical protein